MTEENKVFTATNKGHGVQHYKQKNSVEKVNVVLKNTIGPHPTIKKVRIPIDTPIHKLKAKIAEIYNIDPNDFQLSHVPRDSSDPASPEKIKITSTKSKATVKIVLKDRDGVKQFQKKLHIPDSISIGELREEVSRKLGMAPDEFTLSLEKLI